MAFGPFDPLLLLGRELVVVACSNFDGGDELAQPVRALQPARVAKQGAQLATFLVARADLRFASGAHFLVGPLAALLFILSWRSDGFSAERFAEVIETEAVWECEPQRVAIAG